VLAARAVKEVKVMNRMARADRRTMYQDKKTVLLIDIDYLEERNLLGNIYIAPLEPEPEEESHHHDIAKRKITGRMRLPGIRYSLLDLLVVLYRHQEMQCRLGDGGMQVR
jgi:hypothetical protein